MRLVATKNLFLSTANRDGGTSYSPIFNMPPGALRRGEGQMMRLTLLRWSVFVAWYNVNETNNAFVFTNTTTGVATTILLEAGNYPYAKLAKIISAAYSPVVVTYDVVANKLVFTFVVPHTLSFTNASHTVLGFDGADTVATDANNAVRSTGILKGRAADRVLVGVNGVTPAAGGNLENVSAGDMRISDLLAAVTITAPPYSYLNYVNVTGDEFALFISDQEVQKLGIDFEDPATGGPATFLDGYDSELVVKVDTFDMRDATHQNVTLAEIKHYLRLILISGHLKDLPEDIPAMATG